MNLPPRLRRLAGLGTRFLIVGGLSTLIEVVVFNILVFGLGWDLVWAKVVASVVALANAYFGNREWTFRHRDRRGRTSELILFLLANAACTALGAALVWAGVAAVEAVTETAAGPVVLNVVNLASIAIVVLARFVLYHAVVFRVPDKDAATAAVESPASAEHTPS